MQKLSQAKRSPLSLFSLSLWLLASGLTIGQAQSTMLPWRVKAPLTNFNTHLPLVHIVTDGQTINGEKAIPVKMAILDEGDNNSDNLLSLELKLTAKLKIRGHSSAKFAKKQYDLEFTDPDDEEKKMPIAFLGLPKHHNWALGAPYIDPTLVRNSFTYALARNIVDDEGHPWYAPRTKSFELFLNKSYQGVYILTEKISASKERVPLAKWKAEEGDKNSFLLKIEKPRKTDLPTDYFKTKNGVAHHYVEPKAKTLVKELKENAITGQRSYDHIQGVMKRFEAAIGKIKEGDYSYRQMIDVDSFINYILVQEVVKNVDAYRRSLYIYYKDGLLHMGPIWDFDLALGNLHIYGEEHSYGFQMHHGLYFDGNQDVNWFSQIVKDPTFMAQLLKRYASLRVKGRALNTEFVISKFKAMTDELKIPQTRNFTVWNPNGSIADGGVIIVIPNYYFSFEYESIVGNVEKWLTKRLDWLDKNLAKIDRK